VKAATPAAGPRERFHQGCRKESGASQESSSVLEPMLPKNFDEDSGLAHPCHDESFDVGGEVARWTEELISPLELRFSQHSLHPFFFKRGPVEDVLPEIRATAVSSNADCTTAGGRPSLTLVAPFPSIQVVRHHGALVSLDNRRLYALQLAALERWPSSTPTWVLVSEKLSKQNRKAEWRKLTTESGGFSVRVETLASRQAGNAGGEGDAKIFCWASCAIEKEADHFLRPLHLCCIAGKVLALFGLVLAVVCLMMSSRSFAESVSRASAACLVASLAVEYTVFDSLGMPCRPQREYSISANRSLMLRPIMRKHVLAIPKGGGSPCAPWLRPLFAQADTEHTVLLTPALVCFSMAVPVCVLVLNIALWATPLNRWPHFVTITVTMAVTMHALVKDAVMHTKV